MRISDIKTMLSQTGLPPTTYYSFPEKDAPQLPYTVWYLPNSSNFAADNKVYGRIDALNIELYTDNRDFAMEEKLEEVLDENGLVWDKSVSYLRSENMYEVLYEMETIINGEQD